MRCRLPNVIGVEQTDSLRTVGRVEHSATEPVPVGVKLDRVSTTRTATEVQRYHETTYFAVPPAPNADESFILHLAQRRIPVKLSLFWFTPESVALPELKVRVNRNAVAFGPNGRRFRVRYEGRMERGTTIDVFVVCYIDGHVLE